MNTLWWTGIGQLDDEQKAVLNLPVAGRYFVSGPPGSGKTNVLVLRAKYLEKSSITNFKVLAFTNTLTRFIQASKKLDNDNVQTAASWLSNMLWELEGKQIKRPDFKEQRQLVCHELAEHMRKHRKAGLLHTLLIDEIQDYSLAEIELFMTMAEHVFFVGDVRQQIYESDLSVEALSRLARPLELKELTRHYRIGRNICRLADRLAKPSKGHVPMLDSCCYDEATMPSEVEHLKLSQREQVARVIERCKLQLEAYPGELIGVLCPKNEILDAVEGDLRRALGTKLSVQKREEHSDFDLASPVVLSTIHSSKGLEFRCVHVLEAQQQKMPHPREVIYTAATRAKTSLSLYYSDKLKPFLADALAGMGPPAPAPTAEDLFE